MFSFLERFQPNVAGTTYYYPPEEDISPEANNEMNMDCHNGQTSKKSNLYSSSSVLANRRTASPSSTLSSQPPFSMYPGIPSFLPNSTTGQQRTSFFMNEDIRSDLVRRNSIALTAVETSAFPGKFY